MDEVNDADIEKVIFSNNYNNHLNINYISLLFIYINLTML